MDKTSKTKSSTIKTAYKNYPYKYQPKHLLFLEYNKFKEILLDINSTIFEEYIKNGLEYSNRNIGTFRVRRVKTTNHKKIDFKKSKELGKNVYYDNSHTFGYHIKTQWIKSSLPIYNKNIYKFNFVRAKIRSLSKQLQETNDILTKFYD